MLVKKMRFGNRDAEYITLKHRDQYLFIWTEDPITNFNGSFMVNIPVFSFTVLDRDKLFYDDTFSPKQPINDMLSILYKIISSYKSSHFAIRIFNGVDITPMLSKLNVEIIGTHKSSQLNREFVVFTCNK